MKLAKCRTAAGDELVVQLDGDVVRPLNLAGSAFSSLADIIEADEPAVTAAALVSDEQLALADVTLLAPIDQQEVWAGVTYKRSQTARMEESETSASCYDLVYDADRPELFLKATPTEYRDQDSQFVFVMTRLGMFRTGNHLCRVQQK